MVITAEAWWYDVILLAGKNANRSRNAGSFVRMIGPMTPERLEQIRKLYAEALELAPGERGVYLAQSCGPDTDLLAEVESLLSQSNSSDSSIQGLHILARKATAPTELLSSAAALGQLSLIGNSLKGRYRLKSVLGRGGFGVVYLATDEQLVSRLVVVKIMLNTAPDAWERGKFQTEIKALARLNHPGIVSIYDSGETSDGRPFLVMGYVEGESLRSIIRPEGVELQRVADIIRQVAAALDAAHRNGIWHRDLKPENIMLKKLPDGAELAVIIDFGIAAIKDSRVSESDPTKIAGSVLYMAPEQLRGNPEFGSDIYSLGIIAYEMVAGKHPFSGRTSVELFLQQQEGIRIKPTELRKELPTAAEATILKALSFRPEERQSGAIEFGAGLSMALRPASVQANGEDGPAVVSTSAMDPTKIEIGFVLFMDFVGSSMVSSNRQAKLAEVLTKVEHKSGTYKRAHGQGNVINVLTRHGMALVFFGEASAPAQCAEEIAMALKNDADIKLRMGISAGPVCRSLDIVQQRAVAGSGIDMARCVMDCGNAGHILVARPIAKLLSRSDKWSHYLHYLGERKPKHGEKLQVFNLYTETIGNANTPDTFKQTRRRAMGQVLVALAGLGAGGTAMTTIYLKTHPAKSGFPGNLDRTFTYHFMVQRYRKGLPFREPFRISKEMTVEVDDRIQFAMSSPQSGHLYLLSEGPLPDNLIPTFNTLFPSPSGNDGSSFVAASQSLVFPGTITLAFDNEEGAEKLWVLWSSQPLHPFEALKEWTMSGHDGSVKNLQQRMAIRDFLANRALAAQDVDDVHKQTTLSQEADPLVYLMKFEHH